MARWAAPDGAVPAAEGAVARVMVQTRRLRAQWRSGAVAAAAPYSPTQRYAGEKPLAKSGVGAVVSRR